MTKWKHFRHALGLHDWRKIKEYDAMVEQKLDGPHDPRPPTREITLVDAVCCSCGEKKTVNWFAWVGL